MYKDYHLARGGIAQNGLRVASGFESKLCASIINQIEFHIMGSILQLFFFLFQSKGLNYTTLINRHNRV